MKTMYRPYEIQHLPTDDIQVLFLDNETSIMIKNETPLAYEFMDEYFNDLQASYPDHIDAVEQMLTEIDKTFPQLKLFPRKYKARIVVQSMKCLFGNMDNIPDRDANGQFNFEKVQCPIRSRCKYNGYAERNKHNKCVICNPVRKNQLHTAELDVAQLLAEPEYTIQQIADKRNVSPNTIRNQRKNIFRKLGVRNRLQLSEIVKTQRLV